VYYAGESAGNQRQLNCLVGTSETTRAAFYPKYFCEWLAGLIDGDGCLLTSKQGYTSCEITIGLADERCLRFIQDKFGGSIKMRSGARAWRYRLHNKKDLLKLINCINGHIRHTTRLKQLHRVCLIIDIPCIIPTNHLSIESGWIAGFFDAEGTLTFSMKNNRPQLSLRVTNKLQVDVEPFKSVFGGNIYYDSSQNGYYQWSIQSRQDLFKVVDYFKCHPVRSAKSHRVHLVTRYFELYDIRAFVPTSRIYKAWQAFIIQWDKMMI